jgi:hypothetical protein
MVRMAPLSSISKLAQVSRTYLQSFAQICIATAPTLAYKDRIPTLSACTSVLLFPSPPLTTDNLVLCAAALVHLTAPHRSTNDHGGTHRHAHSSSLLQDPNTRVMLLHFPYPCFLDFYFHLHSCK